MSDNERDAVAEARAMCGRIHEWLRQDTLDYEADLAFGADLLDAADDTLRRLADECDALRAALAQRIATSGTPPVVDVTHYVPFDLDVLRGNAAPEPPPRETGAERDEAWRGIGE